MKLELVEEIVTLIRYNPVSEIIYEAEGRKITARRPLSAAPAAPAAAPEPSAVEPVAEPAAPEEHFLLAPMVGLFRVASPPIAVGMTVKPGQTVGQIESMKLLNPVPLEDGGRIAELFVEEGSPVEYGQPLLRFEPVAGG